MNVYLQRVWDWVHLESADLVPYSEPLFVVFSIAPTVMFGNSDHNLEVRKRPRIEHLLERLQIGDIVLLKSIEI
jgi:hypothetical protein